METNIIEKDLIFYNPGQPGTAFTYSAGRHVNSEIITQAKEMLEYETENPIVCVEERREQARSV